MDLIPEDYRRYLQQLSMFKIWGSTVFVLLIVSTSISFALNYKADIYQNEIVSLEKKKAISSLQRNVLQDLQKDHEKLKSKHHVLEKLRGGAMAKNMFVTVDRALEGNDVWFKKWRFDRAGSKTKVVDKKVNTGYFIVIPENETKSNKTGEAWKIQTQMEVNGEAKDHEALARFVRRLLQQKQIGDVRILNTRQQMNTGITVVDFKLGIIVNSQVTSS